MDVHRIWKILKKIIFLPTVPTLLVAIPSYIFVIWVLTHENTQPLVAIASYLLSSYATFSFIMLLKNLIKWLFHKILGIPLVQRFLQISSVKRFFKEKT